MRNQEFLLVCMAIVLLIGLDPRGAAPAAGAESLTAGGRADQITFTGKVLDAQGQPVADAGVILYQNSYGDAPYAQKAALVGEKTTGADGVFAFAVARESPGYREGYILARKEGLALGWRAWHMRTGDQQADVTLGAPQELAGEVVDENGKALANVDVSIALTIIGKEEERRYFVNYLVGSELLAVKTGANGRFVFPHMPAEATCELLARSPGRATVCTFDPSLYRGEVLQFAPGKTGIKITLPPEAKIQGMVVEKASGKPIPGVRLMARPDSRGFSLPQDPLVSAQDGSFSVGSLAPGQYIVQLTPRADEVADWVSEPVKLSVNAGETKSDLKLELVKGGLIEVLVKEDPGGKPVHKASVNIRDTARDQWLSSLTNETGLAQLRVSPGAYEVAGAYKEGYTRPSQQPGPVEVQEGETKRVEYMVTPAPRVAGVVRDEAGNPVAGVKIEIKPSSPEEKVTGTDGKFEVSWDPSNWGPQSTTFVLVARDVAKNLAAAAEIDDQSKNLDLKLKPGITFTGKVLNHEGKPLADARIRIMLRVSNWGSPLGRGETGKTASDGTFEVKGIPAEREYGVTALAEGYGKVEVQADTNNAKDNRMDLGEFKLAPADQSISGMVVDGNDKPVAGARIYAYGENQPDNRDIQTDSEGKFVIKNVCAGPMRLNASVGGSGRLYGNIETKGSATDVKIVVSERSPGRPFIPKKPQSLAGKPLPDLKNAGVELPADAGDRMLLVCLWDMNQRPSRYCLTQLTRQAAPLGEKGVAIVALQASKIEPSALSQWIEKNKPPFPVGCLAGDVEKARFAWGAVSLPHLILTDKKHMVVAEGFALGELDKKLEEATGR